MSTEPYLTQPHLLRYVHADREREFLQVAERRRAIRAIAPSSPTQRVLRWTSAGRSPGRDGSLPRLLRRRLPPRV